MVEQLYTNARTGTYKHPSRYAVATVGIGRGARSGWVGAGQRMGQVGTSDGSERDNAPSLRGREHLYSAR